MKRITCAIMALVVMLSVTMPTMVFAQSVDDYPVLSSNFNGDAVQNHPNSTATFSTPKPLYLQVITVYHWNGGNGANPGTISLYDADTDEAIGTFLAEGRFGNTYWDCYPDITISAGKYYIKDSGWETASWNSGAPGGMMELRGTVADSAPTKDVPQSSSNNSSSTSSKQQYYFSSWAKGDIERAMSLGIIPESLNGDDLSEGISRQQFAAVAVKAYEQMSGSSLSSGSNPFSDTSDSYVLKAANADIVAGTSSTTFSPYNGLTREQAAAMLTRAYKKTVFSGWSLDNDYALEYSSGDRFDDYDEIRPYARESVGFLYANGVISGVGYNMFAPEGTLTKEQAIAIAVRMIDKLDTAPKSGKKTETTTESTTKSEVKSSGGSLKSGDIINWGSGTITYTEKPVQKRELSGSELSKYDSGSAKAIAGYSYSNEDGDHLLLDHRETVSFDLNGRSAGTVYAELVSPDGTRSLMSPDPAELDRGRYTFETFHFSDAILMSDEEQKVMEKFIDKAAYKYVMDGETNVTLKQSIQETIQEKMSDMGLAKGQVAGEIARYVVNHAAIGRILTAGVDGDTTTLRKELANVTGEYLLGKLIKNEQGVDITSGEKLPDDMAFIKQSLGDNADAISKGIADNDMKTQLVEIVKNVEKNIFPQIDKVERFAKVCGVMKKMWEDTAVDDFYRLNFKANKESGQPLSFNEFDAISAKCLHGVSWSSQIDTYELYEQFELRYKNEKKIEQTGKDMERFFNNCYKYHNIFADYNFKDDPESKTFDGKLSRLWALRNTIKEIVTVNGKISKGDIPSDIVSSNDEDFFAELVDKWIYYSNYPDEGNFFQYLVDHKILTPKQAKKISSNEDDICICSGDTVNPFCPVHSVITEVVTADPGETAKVDTSSLETY